MGVTNDGRKEKESATLMNYDDIEYYLFHEDDTPDRCFLCSKVMPRPIVVRHIETMKMTHLCEVCFINNFSDYLLDNTRPWLDGEHTGYKGAEPRLRRIVVAIKQVPDTTQVRVDPDTGTLIREGVPFIMNPFDTHAIEEALRIKDLFGCAVTVLTMGPPNSVATLRKCLAMGADDAILVSDRAFGGADTLATSFVLAEAIRRSGQERGRVDLVICGKQTIDGDTAQVGPGIATRLGLSQLTLVDRILTIDPRGRTITVRRKLEGRREVIRAPLPSLLTVVREINQPRYSSVTRRIAAETPTLEVWDNTFLQLPANKIGLKGSPTNVKRIFAPERQPGEILGDGERDPEGAVQELIRKLIERDLLVT
jgi:Electron transfer flavoprotein, beta subunit